MAESYPASARHEMPDQIERAIQFRRQRDDGDAVARSVDFRKDVATVEPANVRRRARVRRRQPQAFCGLRPAECRIDEIALEMRRQHLRARFRAGRQRVRSRAKGRHALQHLTQGIGRARDRRRTERGDAEFWKTRRNRADHVAAIERVEAFEAVNMDVHESGDQDMATQILFAASRVGRTRNSGSDVNDAFAVDHEDARRLDASG